MKMKTLSAQEFLQNDDDIFIIKERVKGRCAMHAHEFIEIAYIAEGKGSHTVCGETSEVSAGDLFLLNAHVAHEFRSDPDRPLLVYNCIFQPLSVDRSLKENDNFVDVAYRYLMHTLGEEDAPGDYLRLRDGGRQPLKPLLEDLFSEFKHKEAGYRQVLKADLIKLLIACFRLYRQQPGQESAFAKLVAEQALDYLKAHYSQPVRCEDLAARCYLSVSYFSKIFKKVTGTTMVQMLQSIRLQNAMELLTRTDLPVAQVAQRVGYSDVKYFYKLFEQSQGVSPGAYRSANRSRLPASATKDGF